MIRGFAGSYQMSLCCAGGGFPQRWARFLYIWKTVHILVGFAMPAQYSSVQC